MTTNLSYETLKEILDNAFDEIFVYDDNYTVIYVNKACERHYGMSQEDMIGKTFFELIDKDYWYPSTLPIVYEQKRRVTMEQKSYLGETLITTSVPVLDKKGNIKHVVMSVRDSMYELDIIREKLEEESLNEENKESKDKSKTYKDEKVIYVSKEMDEIMKVSKKIAKVDTTILIRGESGTGKSLIANYIHKHSNRKDKSLLTINCAAIPETLLESELFGYEKGAFTGAGNTGKVGLIELANNGTIFLDEVGELSPKIQAKLLHVIQDKTFMRVGGKEERKVDVRIITATNRDLYKMVGEGSFREDLYWRLNVIDIEVPPLRYRKKDILAMANYFLNKFNRKYNYSRSFEDECMEFFISYKWPGNIRQLENLIERLVVTSKQDKISVNDLPKIFIDEIKEYYNSEKIEKKKDSIVINENVEINSFDEAVYEFEKNIIKNNYEKYKSSRKVAEKLNISQTKASRLIRKYCE